MRRIEQSPDVVADEEGFNDEERSELREIAAMMARARGAALAVEQAVETTIAFELDPSVLHEASDEDLEELAVGVVGLLGVVRLRDTGEFARLLRVTAKVMPLLRSVEVSDGLRPKEVLELGAAVHTELVARSICNAHLVAVADELEEALAGFSAVADPDV